jgi:amino acid transporter
MGQHAKQHTEGEGEPKKFGTFDGVFLPNILAVLGVIMYLRQGTVMGNTGLLWGITLILVAHVVTFTTGLSLSSVATNMRVRAGGAYYIISRSLGIEWGGCIGIPLALSQTLSIALYTLGFAESIKELTGYPMNVTGTLALAAMTVLSLRGSSLVIRSQYLIFGVVIVSLIAIFAGHRLTSEGPVLHGAFQTLDFWQAFALYFPAVTGIMTGVSLSGNLRNPSRSIPLGTMASVLTGLVVYLVLGTFLCYYADTSQLIDDQYVLLKIAWRPEPVIAGIWAATISSGLGMILSAPRTIQALANDGVLPRILAREHGKSREPMIAMIAALIIAEAAILTEKLDLVAPVLSMFFLVTYGMLNLIAGLESLIDNPSYRPTIKIPWYVSLFGAGCCFYVMFLINTPATLTAFAVVAATYLLLKHRHLKSTWGDLRRGFWLSLIRRSLLQVDRLPEHPKNWRPNVMVVTGIPQGRLDLVALADWLGSRRGLVTFHHVLVGPYEKLRRRKRMALNNLVRFINEHRLNALASVDVVEHRTQDLRKIIASQGFGTFRANTVMLDWRERDELKPGEFEELCTGVIAAHKTLLVLHVDSDRKFGDKKRIDVWVDRDSVYLPMMMLLAYLVSQDRDWKGSRIRVHVTGRTTDSSASGPENLLAGSRIPVEPVIHDDLDSADLSLRADPIVAASVGTDLLIVPFPYDGTDSEEMKAVLDRLGRETARLPSVLLVRGQAHVDLKE